MTTSHPHHPQLRPDELAAMSPQQKRLLLKRLLEQQAETAKCFGMSTGQQGLWYAFRRDPTSTSFNVFLPTRVVSPLDLGALKQAIDYLASRHPCLRTTFSDKGAQLSQTVHPSLPPEFEVIDARHLDEAMLRAQVLAQTQRPFDLECGPLLRLAVFVRGPQDHVIVATTHHIVVDFWSLVLVLTELGEIYRSFAAGAAPSLPPSSANYASFVADQQAMLTSPRAEHAWQHWKRTLDGAPLVLNWFTDFERPPAFSGKANVVSIPFPSDVASQVKRIATEKSTTPAAVVLAALQVFIARYTGEKDFLIGSPFSGRGHQKYEATVGFFVNMLPIRAQLHDNPTFSQLVRRASESLLTSLEHEDFPLAEIVRRIQPPRDPSRSPLFQVTCTFEKSHLREEAGRAAFLMPAATASADIGGMKQESFYVPHPTCHHDVEFIFEQTESAWRGMICYCRDLFDEETAHRMAENFATLISNLTSAPLTPLGDIPWSVPNHHPLSTNNSSSETLTRQLEESLERHSDAIAFVDGKTSVTYRQLHHESRRVALTLRAHGVQTGDLVPFVGTPGPRSITATVGILRSGAAVVPIDARHPAVSISDLRDDTRPKLIVVDQASNRDLVRSTLADDVTIIAMEDLLRHGINSASSHSSELPKPAGDDLAYVIYTSGSTGKPKGVCIEQGAIANTIRWRCEHVSVSADDRVLMLLSHQFDAGFGIAISTLAQGATLVWPTSRVNVDLHQLLDTLRDQRITVLPAVPSLLQVLARHPRFTTCRSLRQIWSGGEQMPTDLPQQIHKQLAVRLWNFYGPTEASVEATAYEIVTPGLSHHHSRRIIPIGRPISNTDVIVLDECGQVVPDTVPGQLAILGRGLARGYLNRTEQTNAAFVQAPSDQTLSPRMYLTGDLGRRRADGCLEWLGRIDDQVKLHGYRIELEEIERILRMHPGVANAAAKIVQPNTASARLIAYVVSPADPTTESCFNDQQLESIRRHVTAHLPSHKRPSQIHVLPELPLSANGKVNRDRLPDEVTFVTHRPQQTAPSTPLEQHIATLWSELLGTPIVDIHQNFFELGGSSLQAAMMTARLSEDLGVHVPTALVFDLADIASISERLATLHPQTIRTRFGEHPLSHHEPSPLNNSRHSHPLIATLRPSGDREPIFMVHPPGGIVICYRELALHADPRRPFLAIRSRGLHGLEALPETIQSMAAEYVAAIRSAQSNGPYLIGGWSLGGVIAYEVAKQLLDQGETVAKLILLDSTIPAGASDLVDPDDSSQVGLEYGIDLSLQQLSELDEDAQLPFLWQHAVNLGVIEQTSDRVIVDRVLSDLKHLFNHHVKLTSEYRIEPIDASILLVRPQDTPVVVKSSLDRGWGRLVKSVDVKFVPGHHHSMVAQPHVKELARTISESLD